MADRGYRNHNLRRPSGDYEPASYRSHGGADNDYDRGYRHEFRSVAAYGGPDRRLEIVRGNVYSANQLYTTSTPPRRALSPDPPRYPPPDPRPSFRSGGASAWCFSDPEMKRKRRVAKYKVYMVEGKLKSSLRKGWRWVKVKCSRLVHGW